MIAASSDQISAVSAECTIPHPPLVTMECIFQCKLLLVDAPDLGCVVGRAGCKMPHIWREENTRYVLYMCLEFGDRNELGNVAVLNHTPYIAIALDRRDLSVSYPSHVKPIVEE